MSHHCGTQNQLLLQNLLVFYRVGKNLDTMLSIINGESPISLRIVDWFATNYSKKNYTVIQNGENRFKVYLDYKLKLKAYSKKRFDPFCRWDRINIPYKNGTDIQTTIGQLNFFKWALENNVVGYIEDNYSAIENDMNSRNSTSKKNQESYQVVSGKNTTRKQREELSISAAKSIKKEEIKIVVTFD